MVQLSLKGFTVALLLLGTMTPKFTTALPVPVTDITDRGILASIAESAIKAGVSKTVGVVESTAAKEIDKAITKGVNTVQDKKKEKKPTTPLPVITPLPVTTALPVATPLPVPITNLTGRGFTEWAVTWGITKTITQIEEAVTDAVNAVVSTTIDSVVNKNEKAAAKAEKKKAKEEKKKQKEEEKQKKKAEKNA